MNYKEFMKITDLWSDKDKISLLLEYPEWHEMFMRFIMHQWRDGVVEPYYIATFANDHGIMDYTALPTEEDE